MNKIETPLKGCFVIEPEVFGDERGFFFETYHKEKYQNLFNDEIIFVQDNFSSSIKGVLRGLHYQKNNPQGKLVSVISGEVYDVAVDLRKDSDSFGKWFAINLSQDNKKQLWIPPGFAHGFQVISERADFLYKCTQLYNPSDERSIIWNDPTLGIDWPINTPILSKKDASAKKLNIDSL